MPIDPKSGETEDEFISRCMSTELSPGASEDERSQAAAICHDKARDAKAKGFKFATKEAERKHKLAAMGASDEE